MFDKASKLTVTKTLAYYFMKFVMAVKSFMKQPLRACTIKLFRDVIYARVFVSGKPFQPSLMFVVKARAYPREAPFKCSTLG